MFINLPNRQTLDNILFNLKKIKSFIVYMFESILIVCLFSIICRFKYFIFLNKPVIIVLLTQSTDLFELIFKLINFFVELDLTFRSFIIFSKSLFAII